MQTFEFRRCKNELDHDNYMQFLLRHHDELNLPYPFAVKLSFISSPLLIGQAMLIWSDEPYEIAGAAGFVYGTGANQYEDRDICQVEIAFLRRLYRQTSLFAQGLLALLQAIEAGNPDVRLVQFWAKPEQLEAERLFAKLHSLPGSHRFIVNELACQQIDFRELRSYCRRFENRFVGNL